MCLEQEPQTLSPPQDDEQHLLLCRFEVELCTAVRAPTCTRCDESSGDMTSTCVCSITRTLLHPEGARRYFSLFTTAVLLLPI